MAFPWIAAATALGAGASFFGARESSSAQQAANEENRRIAEMNIAFQREGMQNRHQWEVEDLLKAGLNPLLSVHGGGPIGMGASAHMENPKPNRGELYVSTAKALADISLTKELVDTEKTKQALNLAEAKSVQTRTPGTIPFTNIPFSSAKQWASGHYNRFKDAVKRGMFSTNPNFRTS